MPLPDQIKSGEKKPETEPHVVELPKIDEQSGTEHLFGNSERSFDKQKMIPPFFEESVSSSSVDSESDGDSTLADGDVTEEKIPADAGEKTQEVDYEGISGDGMAQLERLFLKSLSAMEQKMTALESAFAKTVGQLEQKEQAIQQAIEEIGRKQDKNDRQLTQYLRENVGFQVQVRERMQKEVDTLKTQLSGEQFNPILKVLAEIYAEYLPLVSKEDDLARLKKNMMSLFEELEDLLDDYGAEIVESRPGQVRASRGTKIVEKVFTGDQDKHNTIVCSRKPGVMKDRLVLREEYVDVYVYDPSLAQSSEEKKEEKEIQQKSDESQMEEITQEGDNRQIITEDAEHKEVSSVPEDAQVKEEPLGSEDAETVSSSEE